MPHVLCENCGVSCYKRPSDIAKSAFSFCSKSCQGIHTSSRLLLIDRLMQKVRISDDGCWLFEGSLSSSGYGRLLVKGKEVLTHRLSWEHHFHPIPDAMLVCHHCDVRNCVNPDHLFIGTHCDNMRDMRLKGRSPKGEDSAVSVLDNDSVHYIKSSLLASKKIARQLGVSCGAIRAVRRGETWTHVE